MQQTTLDLFAPTSNVEPSLHKLFPSTRYQGSKRKMLPFLESTLAPFAPCTALDLYSGTSSVSLLLRAMGCNVIANDYTLYNYTTAKLLLSLNHHSLNHDHFLKILEYSFTKPTYFKSYVSDGFNGIYFKDAENLEIDIFCHNITSLSENDRILLIYLMGQAMLMKRPYNLFHRANLGMRTKDVERSFGNAKTWETSFQSHMKKLFVNLSKFPFGGQVGRALNLNTMNLSEFDVEPDLVYLDPPYLNKSGLGVNYADFYNFLEGLVDYELFLGGDPRYPHKPIANYPSSWTTGKGGLDELSRILNRWPTATIALSYRGDGRPSIEEVKAVFSSMGYALNEHFATEYKYALSKNSETTEEIIVATRI